jgi:myo-inositol-1(or 4)-monophosphatase
MNEQLILEELKILCKSTGEFIREHFGKLNREDIVTKEKNSLVSFVDREAEKMITGKLFKLIPEATFITEEDSVENKNHNLQWIVDPLDGTTNYLSGIPFFSISIALRENNRTLIGMVYDVMHNDVFFALKGKGAFKNDQKIRVASSGGLDDSIIATGFPYDKTKIDERVLAMFNYFVKNGRAVRRLGSASLDLCYIAQGTFHLYYERFLNAWDIAAGALIVEEAGGRINDFNGEKEFLSRGEIIAFCPGMEEQNQWLINKAAS